MPDEIPGPFPGTKVVHMGDNVWAMTSTAPGPDDRRYHTDETRLCENCQLAASPTRRLMRCKGCNYAWYCTAECQKEAWKKGHKEECKEQRRKLANAPKAIVRAQEGMRDWIRQKHDLLGFAGDEALLPARDRPDHNLLSDKILVVNLMRTPKGEFEVLQARIGEHAEMLENFKKLDNEELYWKTMDHLKEMEEGTEKRTGEKLLGTMHIMVRCVVNGHCLLQLHPLFVKQEAIATRMQADHRPDWAEQFKMFVRLNRKMYRSQDGNVYGVMAGKK